MDLRKYVAPFPDRNRMFNLSGLQNEEDFASFGCDIYLALTEASPVEWVDYNHILDFGCGCGSLARMFKGHPHQIYACDIDRNHIKWMKKHLAFVKAEHSDIHPPTPYKDNFFDAIVSISVFTHLNEASQDEFLTELHRIAHPGGHLYVTVHGRQAINRAKEEDQIWNMLSVDSSLFQKAEKNPEMMNTRLFSSKATLPVKSLNTASLSFPRTISKPFGPAGFKS